MTTINVGPRLASESVDAAGSIAAASERSPHAMLVVRGLQATIVWSNDAACDLLLREDLVGVPLDTLVKKMEYLQRRSERSSMGEISLLRANGTSVVTEYRTLPTGVQDEYVIYLQPSRNDGAQARIAAAQKRVVTLVERSPIPTMTSDVGVRLGHVNDAMCRLLGRTAEDLVGFGWLASIHPEDVEAVQNAMYSALEGTNSRLSVRISRPDGQVRRADLTLHPVQDSGEAAAFIGALEDTTERLELLTQLSFQARHDALTGLPNRTGLTEHIERCLTERSRYACLFIDLDNFKTVNDGLGHAVGDELLAELACRLSATLRDGDVAARWGGDEFVVMARIGSDDSGLVRLGERLLEALRAPVMVSGQRITPTASIGAARLLACHRTVDDLLRDADAAMYAAKRSGRNRMVVCDETIRSAAAEEFRLVEDLRDAISSGGLSVEYQPIVSATTEQIVLAEALVRWRHPVQGLIGPDRFVPLAEAHGLIAPLGNFVLNSAMHALAALDIALGQRAPRQMSVNFSAAQLDAPGLADNVLDSVGRVGLSMDRLCVEVTESMLAGDRGVAIATLERLRAAGASVAVDDFGTGFSSLSVLQDLPLDHLKIDKSFVQAAASGRTQVCSVVANLASTLGLEAVAEGVEDAASATQLRGFGVPLLQGWHYSKSLTPSSLIDWIGAR